MNPTRLATVKSRPLIHKAATLPMRARVERQVLTQASSPFEKEGDLSVIRQYLSYLRLIRI